MDKKENIRLFLVDDDAIFLKALEIDFSNHTGFSIKTFSSGELCIEHLSENPDVIILDYHLDGINRSAINGIDTLDIITSYNPEITVIMLSSQDKIEVAVSCMHHGAFDYIVKSETAFIRLKKTINMSFRYKNIEKQLNWYMDRT